MGFTFRKRNPKGLNFSISSRGARVSKTIKLGNLSFNVGRYIGGTHDGKTTSRVTANGGNGFRYEKNYTLGSRDTNPSLTKELRDVIDQKYNLTADQTFDEGPTINIISKIYLSVWGPLVIFLSLLCIIKGIWVVKSFSPAAHDVLVDYAIWLMLVPFALPWVFILPYANYLKWDDGIGGPIMRGTYTLIGMGFTLYFIMNLGTIWHYTIGWFFRA